MNKPPATPGDLRIPAVIYKRVVVGRDPSSGQTRYNYVRRRRTMVRETRQRSDSAVLAHTTQAVWQSVVIGNWWNFRDVQPTDMIVFGQQALQFGFDGPVVNWEQRNRWAIAPLVAVNECLPGIDSCHCRKPMPEGTVTQDYLDLATTTTTEEPTTTTTAG